MRRSLLMDYAFIAICALVGMVAATAEAGTIKLSLGSDPGYDIEFDGTTLSTVDDGGGGTGEQSTNVEFIDFLSNPPNINDLSASFTLDDLVIDGGPTVLANVLVLQNFLGGYLELYDGSNTLLLSGDLDKSTLAGPIGPPASGALFTTSFGNITGGTLASELLADTLTLSLTLTSINGGGGFSVGNVLNPVLAAFEADATAIVAAENVPEPASLALLILGIVASLWAARRR